MIGVGAFYQSGNPYYFNGLIGICDRQMSEELKRYIEEAVYKYIKRQIEEGKFSASLRIEIDSPIEIRGMKGRVVGYITLGEKEAVGYSVPMLPQQPLAKKEGEEEKGEDMDLQDVDKLLRSLGV